MKVLDERDFEYRHADHGPKYLMKGPRSNFGLIRLLGMEKVPGHVHRVMEETFFVLEGRIRVTVGEETVTATEGQLVYIEPGEVHAVENPDETPVKLVVTAAPFCDGDKYSPDGVKL